jgi:Mg-chelatase subunit ChlD
VTSDEAKKSPKVQGSPRDKTPKSPRTKSAGAKSKKATVERFAALKEVGQNSLDLLLVVDKSGSVKYANPTSLATFGISL